MNEGLIRNWNKLVSDEDTVYFLGDFAFCGRKQADFIANQLKGEKYFVPGNHDRKKPPESFEGLEDGHVLEHEGKKFYLSHFPRERWELPDGIDFMLHGHTHGRFGAVSGEKRYDVGVDCNFYAPVSVVEIVKCLTENI